MSGWTMGVISKERQSKRKLLAEVRGEFQENEFALGEEGDIVTVVGSGGHQLGTRSNQKDVQVQDSKSGRSATLMPRITPPRGVIFAMAARSLLKKLLFSATPYFIYVLRVRGHWEG